MSKKTKKDIKTKEEDENFSEEKIDEKKNKKHQQIEKKEKIEIPKSSKLFSFFLLIALISGILLAAFHLLVLYDLVDHFIEFYTFGDYKNMVESYISNNDHVTSLFWM